VAKTAEEVIEALREIEADRPNLDFLIDGAVIKIQDTATRRRFGFTGSVPRWAVAYKFAGE